MIFGQILRSQKKFTYKKVFNFKNYYLSETNLKIDYKIHNDLALLMSTSGTTGNFDFVKQTYKNLKHNTISIIKSLKIKHSDKPITTMPMNYVYGLSIINSHLYSGSLVLVTEKTIVNKSFWNFFKKFNSTTFGGVPFLYEILKKLNFNKMNLPSLKYITQAGGKLSKDLTKEFINICSNKKIKFIIMYGQTEATARMSYLPWKYSKKKIGSIGRPIYGGKFLLKNNKGQNIKKINDIGELVYNGKNVSYGYSKNRFDLVKNDDNKGILYTGDLAKKDSDSFYYIVGRKKRFVKIYGHRISLDNIEKILKKEGFESLCDGNDEKINIFIKGYKIKKNRILEIILKNTNLKKEKILISSIKKFPRNKSGKILYSHLKK